MASIYVRYPKTCRNKKSSVCLTLPTSLTSSSTGSLSSNDGIKSSTQTVSQSKRKHHIYHHAHIRNPKVPSTLPKRKKLKLKKSSPSTSATTTSSDSDTTANHKLDDCPAFAINTNNNIQEEINRNCLYSTCKKII